ncbi:hypothetical protein [Enterovibrio calviensis]|uniref:hypothetical protein n=1 Tax=Enterovibrio calviensis TaxID=91359 RepID=UPI0037354A19
MSTLTLFSDMKYTWCVLAINVTKRLYLSWLMAVSFAIWPLFIVPTISAQQLHYPAPQNMKDVLETLGFEDPWTDMNDGEKLIIHNGEIWLRDGDYFAVLGVSDTNENTMRLSLMNNLTVCAKLGVAVTGQSSSDVFSTFGTLTKDALVKPEQQMLSGNAPFHFHVLVTELLAGRTTMQCGVKR